MGGGSERAAQRRRAPRPPRRTGHGATTRQRQGTREAGCAKRGGQRSTDVDEGQRAGVSHTHAVGATCRCRTEGMEEGDEGATKQPRAMAPGWKLLGNAVGRSPTPPPAYRRRAREIWGAPRRCGGVAHCARIGGCWSPNVAARAPRVNQETDPKCTSCDNLIFDRSTRVDLLSVTSDRHWNLFTWQPDFFVHILAPPSVEYPDTVQYCCNGPWRGCHCSPDTGWKHWARACNLLYSTLHSDILYSAVHVIG